MLGQGADTEESFCGSAPKFSLTSGHQLRFGVITCPKPVHENHGFITHHPGIMARGQHGHITGAKIELRPVLHHDVDPTRDLVLKMRGFTPGCPHQGFHIVERP
jgi:hypothetical protein